MIRPLLLSAALLAATQAAALTCAPPDPVRTFGWAQESSDRYVILHGRLDFDRSRLPESGAPVPPYDPPPGYEPPHGAPDLLAEPVPARFEGFSLGLEGFTRPLSTAITLQPLCTGPWCGTIGPEGTWLLFARVLPDGSYEVQVAPCGGWAFENPSEAVLGRMAACLRGAACGDG
jgi:hypothetical protein